MQIQGDTIRGHGRQLNTYAHQLDHGQLGDELKQALAGDRKPTRDEVDKVIDILVPIFKQAGGTPTVAEISQGVVGLAGMDSGGTWVAAIATLLRPEWTKHPRRCLEENMDHDPDRPGCQRTWTKYVMSQFKSRATAARFLSTEGATPWVGFLTAVAHALLVDMAAIKVNMSNTVKVIVVLGSSETRGKFEAALRGEAGSAAAAVRPSADTISNMMPPGFTNAHTGRLIASLTEPEAGAILAAGKRAAQDPGHALWKRHATTTKGELQNSIAKQFLRDAQERAPEVALEALRAASPDMRSSVFHATAAPHLIKYVATWHKLNEMSVEGFKWEGAPAMRDVRIYEVDGIKRTVTLPPVEQHQAGGGAAIERVALSVAELLHKIRYHATNGARTEAYNHGLRSLMKGYGEADRDFADIQSVVDEITPVLTRLDVLRDMSHVMAYDAVAEERGMCDLAYTHAVLTSLRNGAEEVLETMAPIHDTAANKRAVTVMLKTTRKQLGFGSAAIAGAIDQMRTDMKAFAMGQRQQRKDKMAAEQLALARSEARNAANYRKRRVLPNGGGGGRAGGPDDTAPKRRRGEAHTPPKRGRGQGAPTAPAPKDAAADKAAKKAKVICHKCGVRGHYKYECPSAKFILKQTDGAAPRLLSFKQAQWIGKQVAFDTTRTYDTIESLPAEGKQ